MASLLDGSSAGELIPELARYGLQQLIELEASAAVGADRHERSEERTNYRNGYRPPTLTTQVGDLELLIPKLRSGGFLPTILEPRRASYHGPCQRPAHSPPRVQLSDGLLSGPLRGSMVSPEDRCGPGVVSASGYRQGGRRLMSGRTTHAVQNGTATRSSAPWAVLFSENWRT